MHVVADIGNEYHRNADSMGAGGYRGVLLVESAGEIEHRDVAVVSSARTESVTSSAA